MNATTKPAAPLARAGCGEPGCTRTDPAPCEGCQLAEMRAELECERTAAELSATAADIAANVAEGRGCPDLLADARAMLDTLAADLGETDPDRPVPYTLTPKALAALAEATR